MSEPWIVQFSEINRWLEAGWHKCLRLVEDFIRRTEDSIRERMGFSRLPDEDVVKSLHGFCPELYREISDTLFRLIPLVQPDDCARHQQLNFYFWPGYHSYLANKRIFIKSGAWNFGAGISGNAEAGPLHYYRDCSQARWYHYLVRKRNESEVIPGDVHQWLRFQQYPLRSADVNEATGRTRKLLNSLSATTGAINAEEQELFEGHEALHLDARQQSTKTWGARYAKFINLCRADEGWTFPDRWGKPPETEARLRSLRCNMHAVWLHSVFCNSKPEWLDGFLRQLLGNAETRLAGAALQRGLEDPVAADWGDAALGRPNFSCWSYLSLHASLSPTRFSVYEPLPDADLARKRAIISQTLGSAELLSSVPLRPRYFSLVRPWISEIYALVRNAEISILLQNHKLEARKAELAGPYWAHELMKLTDEGLSTALRDAADTSPAAVSNRRFVLHSIRMVGSLAYAFTGPVFSGEQGAERQKDEFLEPLRELYEKGSLLEALRYVAEQTYENICYGHGGRVIFTGGAATDWKPDRLRYECHRSCFLLVSEMVRNYCENEGDKCIATWEASVKDRSLTVRLIGTTNSQRNPSSMTLARLNVFLHALDIGKANVEWNKEQGLCAYTVEVDLSTGGASPAGEKGLAAQDSAYPYPNKRTQ